MARQRKKFTQKHHISYDPEVIVTLFKGEHWTLTILNRRTKNISKAFIDCLQTYVDKYKDQAVDLR